MKVLFKPKVYCFYRNIIYILLGKLQLEQRGMFQNPFYSDHVLASDGLVFHDLRKSLKNLSQMQLNPYLEQQVQDPEPQKDQCTF